MAPVASPPAPAGGEAAVKFDFKDVPESAYAKLRKEVDVGTLPEYPNSFLPLIVRPLPNSPPEKRSKAFLEDFCRRHADTIEKVLLARGVLCFRGFDVSSPQDFEDAALTLCPKLNNVYHGTSPRNMITTYVFTASELPSFFPIPQHLELSFVPNQPSRLLFWCGQDTQWGGATSLCHFGLVWQDLPEDLRAKFRKVGVKYYRNYSRAPPDTVAWYFQN